MTEENSTHETKKGKKKEDWAEIEFEIGDIEFEAKGRLGYPLADMAQLSGKPLASTPYASV